MSSFWQQNKEKAQKKNVVNFEKYATAKSTIFVQSDLQIYKYKLQLSSTKYTFQLWKAGPRGVEQYQIYVVQDVRPFSYIVKFS